MGFSHRIKKTMFMNRPVNIVLQNENGPCPLLSIANVLILQGSMQIHPDRSEITSDQLVEMIGTHLIDNNPPLKDAALQQNQQQTLNDIMGILPTMENGLDVNVKFDKVSSFEYDARISVFDMLGVSLFHGWVADPNDPETFEVVGRLSYNQLVDRIVLADTKTMQRENKQKQDKAEEEEAGSGVKGSAGSGGDEKSVETKKSGTGEEEDDEVALEVLRQEVEELSETKSGEKEGGGEETREEELEKELKQAREEAGERAEEKEELELEQAIAAKKAEEERDVGGEDEEKGEEVKGEEREEKQVEEEEEDEEVKVLKKEADVARRFLQDTASQLTYLGLTELHNSVDERKLCVFFRNNHFSTMFRMNGDLYLLLTDQGYEKQHTVAWEKLDEINGDTEFVSPEFSEPETYTNFREDLVDASSSDRQLALQLQQEENQRAAPVQSRSPQGMTENEAFVEEQRKMLLAYNLRKESGMSPRGRSRRSGDDRAKKSGCMLS